MDKSGVNRYFEDLTFYTYKIAPYVMGDVKNIGWLDLSKEFMTGPVPGSVFEKLRMLAGGVGGFQPLVEPVREWPYCEVCGALHLESDASKRLPNAELWIPSDDFVYASPVAILHYIECHNYSPPPEYISAIEKVDVDVPFVGDEVYRRKLVDCGWFARPNKLE